MSASNVVAVAWNGRACLFGAALDTGNLGVSALGKSVILGICEMAPESTVAVFDSGDGVDNLPDSTNGRTFRVTRCGASYSKRVYLSRSLWNIRVCARFGGLWNPSARILSSADVVLDISGGDSFTDLYGARRFRSVALPKRIALELGKPLILLPQTYGPFRSKRYESIAKSIVAGASMAWARDQRSYDVLRELLGDVFDPAKHRVGVDVAFGLPAARPRDEVLDVFADWFGSKDLPIVGFNVSGLLMNHPTESAKQYGLLAGYSEVVVSFIRRLLARTNARILLIPHVIAPPGHYESDIEACKYVADAMSKETVDRIAVLPGLSDPCEAKWVIAQCDWFCGTRMHSTIAALSSGVPAAAIAYSAKTLGVFETCGQGDCVADPRHLSTEEMVEQLWRSWCGREEACTSLQAALPTVLNRASAQLEEIIVACAKSQGPKSGIAKRS